MDKWSKVNVVSQGQASRVTTIWRLPLGRPKHLGFWPLTFEVAVVQSTWLFPTVPVVRRRISTSVLKLHYESYSALEYQTELCRLASSNFTSHLQEIRSVLWLDLISINKDVGKFERDRYRTWFQCYLELNIDFGYIAIGVLSLYLFFRFIRAWQFPP